MRRRVESRTAAYVLLCAAALAALPTAGADSSDPGAEVPPTVDEILNTKPSPDDYATGERCVRSTRISRTEILNDRMIVFHLKGKAKEKLLLQMPQRCPGLRRDIALLYEKGSEHRICEHDTVQAFMELGGPGRGRWGPRCILPEFQSVTAEQVEYLKSEIGTRVPSPEAPDSDS